MYLNPLKKCVQQLEEIDFAECKPLLIPLMHVVCTIWGNSRYYNHSSKITVLLRQISNLIIYQVNSESSRVDFKQLLSICFCLCFSFRPSVFWTHHRYSTVTLTKPCNAWHYPLIFWNSFVLSLITIKKRLPIISKSPRRGHRLVGLFIQIQFSNALMPFWSV